MTQTSRSYCDNHRPSERCRSRCRWRRSCDNGNGDIAGDADCSAALTADDCDDADAALGATADDTDCDGSQREDLDADGDGLVTTVMVTLLEMRTVMLL